MASPSPAPTSAFPQATAQSLRATRLVAGFSTETPEDAVATAKAILAGGIDALEVTLRTADAVAGIRAIAEELPDVLLGVGTILTPEQVHQVKDAGAHFGVSPGLSMDVIKAAAECGLPYAPGIATPSELTQAVNAGCRLVKLFPAANLGGVPYLKSIAAPFASLGVEYFPFGGVNRDNMQDYLAQPEVIAVGGTWLAPKAMIQNQQWDQITDVVKESLAALGDQ
ncbi:MAG: bifunctional 4-hydroxy-2-oxoglutarate aldolase/2-dehydro-3-deoxy-phosphogluconate aldolase [Planctomycetota bacterium]